MSPPTTSTSPVTASTTLKSLSNSAPSATPIPNEMTTRLVAIANPIATIGGSRETNEFSTVTP
jgi:hypothetical protein